jgi:hypothetical protein
MWFYTIVHTINVARRFHRQAALVHATPDDELPRLFRRVDIIPVYAFDRHRIKQRTHLFQEARNATLSQASATKGKHCE